MADWRAADVAGVSAIEVTGHTAVVVTASSGRMEDVTVRQLRAPSVAPATLSVAVSNTPG